MMTEINGISTFPEVFSEKVFRRSKHKNQSFGGILSKSVFENLAKFTGKYLMA